MRAYEFITTKIILREYKRDITIRDEKVKQNIYGRISFGAQEDRDLFRHWINSDERIINNIEQIIKIIDYKTNIQLQNRVQNLLNNLRVLNYDISNNDSVIDINRLANTFMEQVEQYDPTKNKIYTPWLLREYLKNNIKRLEDMTGYNEKLTKYNEYKNRRGFPQAAKDITKLDAETLTRVVRRFNPEDPEDLAQHMGKYEVVHGDLSVSENEYGLIEPTINSDVVIIKPLDETASIYFGRVLGGMSEWCTAYTPPRTNYFDSYNRRGPLYIIIPKNPEHEGEKYQLHDESKQYMDENDNPVDIRELLNERFPDLKETVLELIPELRNSINFVDDKKLYKLWHLCMDGVKILTDNLVERLIHGDDDWRIYRWENAVRKRYFLPHIDIKDFNDGKVEVGYDDIDWKKVDNDDDLNSYLSYNESVGDLVGEIEYLDNLDINDIRTTIKQYMDTYDEPDIFIFYLDTVIRAIIRVRSHSKASNANIYRELTHSIERNLDILTNKVKSSNFRLLGNVDNYYVYVRDEG